MSNEPSEHGNDSLITDLIAGKTTVDSPHWGSVVQGFDVFLDVI